MAFSVYQFKPQFQRLLQPVLMWLSRRGTTPNRVTVTTTALMMLYGACLAFWSEQKALWWGLPVVLLVRMALNALDGMLAQTTGQKTRLGAMLNELCDQVSDAALYLPFSLAVGPAPGLVVIAVLLAALAEFAGLAALTVQSKRRFDGPMGKSDRAVAFGLLAWLVASGVATVWMNALLLGVLLLLVWTIANRVRAALQAPIVVP